MSLLLPSVTAVTWLSLLLPVVMLLICRNISCFMSFCFISHIALLQFVSCEEQNATYKVFASLRTMFSVVDLILVPIVVICNGHKIYVATCMTEFLGCTLQGTGKRQHTFCRPVYVNYVVV